VRGLMVLSVSNGRGYSGLLFDREDQFSRSMPGLARQMSASLPKGQGGEGGGGARWRGRFHLQQTCSPTQRLCWPAAGWRITGAYKGEVDISGTEWRRLLFRRIPGSYVNPFPGTRPR